MDSVIARLGIFALEQAEEFVQPELVRSEVKINEISLGPAARNRADFHAGDIQGILVSEEAHLGSLDVRMQRVRSLSNEGKRWRLLDALEHCLFVKELAHEDIQVL